MTGQVFDQVFDERPERLLTIRSRPAWILAGQAGMVFIVFSGFGAFSVDLPPKPFAFLSVVFLGAFIVFGPVRNLSRLIVSAPVVAVVAWWVVSYVWTFTDWAWYDLTVQWIPTIFAGIAFASLLPYWAFARALVVACYLAIGYSVFYTALHPGATMTHADGNPGWHAAFGHKNGMAPFMIFAIITLSTFEHRTGWRRTFTALALVFVIASQSTLGLAVGLVLVPVAWLLRRMSTVSSRASTVVMFFWTTAMSVIGLLTVAYLPVLLTSRGKDPTLTRRTEIWDRAWIAISERPWTGYGIGGVWQDSGAEPTRSMLNGLGFTVFHSHNGYIEVILQVGYVGLILFILLVVSHLYVAFRVMKLDPALSRFMVLYALLILLSSFAEVLTFDIWLAMLCTIYVFGIRVRRETAIGVETEAEPHLLPARATVSSG